VLDVVPTATQEQNQPIGVLDREYGHEPRTVTVHGVAFIRGMRQVDRRVGYRFGGRGAEPGWHRHRDLRQPVFFRDQQS
jgi:hypothetical protein